MMKKRRVPKTTIVDSDELLIKDWQIWHVFSTYVQRPIDSLETVAAALVTSELCDSAMTNEGLSIWWGKDDTVHVGETSIDLTARGTRATVQFPADVPPYALEGLFTAAALRYGELRAFGEDSPVRYVRALVGPCVLESEKSGINLYPIVKLYETGVLLVEMRMVSANSGDLTASAFVHDYVNAPFEEFSVAHVPPTLAELAPIVSADWSKVSHIERIRRAWAATRHRKAVAECVVHEKSGDFDHLFCELPAYENTTETIANIAHLIANTVAYLASSPRQGLRLAFLGQRELLRAGRWSSRPHVHLLRFDQQFDSAATNHERHATLFTSILARVQNAPEAFATNNLRAFNDYGVYVTRAAQLWVYTPKTLVSAEGTLKDPNYGYVIYEQEAVAELLEYAYALSKRLEDEASATVFDPHLVARLRILLIELSAGIDAHVHSGEILDVLRHGYRELGIPERQERIATLLSIKSDLLTHQEEVRTSRWALILTAVFGLIAVPPVATDVIAPLWRLAGWIHPASDDGAKLFFTVIAVCAVVGFIGLIRLLFPRRKRL
jgi:hypothetical protein